MGVYRRTTAAALAAVVIGAGLAGAGTVRAAAVGSSTVTQYTIVPTPIAPPATLAPSATRTITITAYNALGQHVSGAAVWLSFVSTVNGGSAVVATTGVGSTFQSFSSDSHGRVVVLYTAGSATGGKDTLNVQNAQTGATLKGTDSYIYSSITNMVWSPKPIARTSSLSAGQTVDLTLTVFGPTGSPAAGARVLLVFHGSGQALVGSVVLGQRPIAVVTDGSGNVAVTYTSATTSPPPGSTDKVSAEDASRSASIIATDTYTY